MVKAKLYSLASLRKFVVEEGKIIFQKGHKVVTFYGAIFLICLSLLFLFFAREMFETFIPTDSLKVTIFDVGQGDGILIESGSKTKVLIDGGPSKVIVQKIGGRFSYFDSTLDLVSPSHADKDHLSGSVEALRAFPVRFTSSLHASSTTTLDDEYEKESKSSTREDMRAGDSIDIGNGARLTVLAPFEGETFTDKETNESSLVLLLTYKDFSFLFTGDLPMEREQNLLTSGLLPRNLTVLKAGHHGSKGSTGDTLLSYTNPEFVVISAGKDNKYGHPSKDTLARVKKEGAKVLSTIEEGDVTFEVKGGEIEIKTEK